MKNFDKKTTKKTSSGGWSFYVAAVVFLIVIIIGFAGIGYAEIVKTPDVSKSSPSTYHLVSLSGKVEFKKGKNTAFKEMKKESIEVEEGYYIRTSSSGRAALLYPNGIITNLEPETTVRLQELDKQGNVSMVDLASGSVWSMVESSLDENEYHKIRTEGFGTSVRGTEFEVSRHEDRASRVFALSGSVDIAPFLTGSGETKLFAGEQVSIGGPQAEKPEDMIPEVMPMGPIGFKRRILEHAETKRMINNPDKMRAAGIEIIDKGGFFENGPDFLEKIAEAMGDAFTISGKEKSRRNLTIAEEKINEALELLEKGETQKAQKRFNSYRDRVIKAIVESENTETASSTEFVANVVGKHSRMLEGVSSELKEKAGPDLAAMKNITLHAQRQATEKMTDKDPSKALRMTQRMMDKRLRDAQQDMAESEELKAYYALKDYDELAGRLRETPKKNTGQAVRVAREIGGSLSTMNSVEKMSKESSPGIQRVANSVKKRAVNNHISSMADAADRPEKVREMFTESTELYAKRIERNVQNNKSKEAKEDLEVYNEYAEFASEVAGLRGRGKQKTQEKLSRQAQVIKGMEDADSSENFRRGIETALSNLERATSKQIKERNPEEIRKNAERRAPKEGLPTPAEAGVKMEPEEEEEDREIQEKIREYKEAAEEIKQRINRTPPDELRTGLDENNERRGAENNIGNRDVDASGDRGPDRERDEVEGSDFMDEPSQDDSSYREQNPADNGGSLRGQNRQEGHEQRPLEEGSESNGEDGGVFEYQLQDGAEERVERIRETTESDSTTTVDFKFNY